MAAADPETTEATAVPAEDAETLPLLHEAGHITVLLQSEQKSRAHAPAQSAFGAHRPLHVSYPIEVAVVVGAPEERRFHVDGVELAEDGIRRPNGVAVLGSVDGALGRRAQQRRRRTLLVGAASVMASRDVSRSLVRPPPTYCEYDHHPRRRSDDGSDHHPTEPEHTPKRRRRSIGPRSSFLLRP